MTPPRSLRLLVPLTLVAALAPALHASDKPRKATTPRSADQYAQRDAHPGEQVIIAAEPCDNKAAKPDTRIDYYSYNMLPIRVIVTNNSDRALTLEDARIDFIASDNTKVTAATPDDLNRRLFRMKQVKGKTIPLPSPLPSIHTHPKPIDTKILADDEDFGFKTTTVAPHSTVAGYILYDMEGLPDPPLANATLELRKVRWVIPNSATLGDPLDSFEIALHPTPDPK